MVDRLLVFVDALPYASLEEAPFLRSLPSVARLVPGLGYSVNVKAEIFGGYRPDDAGFFCEWMYDPEGGGGRRWLWSVLARVSPAGTYWDRALHKMVSRLLRVELANIPWALRGQFQKAPVNAYEDGFPLPTVFSRLRGLRKVLYSRYPGGTDRDRSAVADAREAVRTRACERLFLALADLDHVTHRVGVGLPEHRAKVRSLDASLRELAEECWTINGAAQVMVVSDHGMANTRRTVAPHLDRHFGRPSERGYAYFVDATLLRVWTAQPGLAEEVAQHLAGLGWGHCLSVEERQRYGLTAARFGDIIFLLDEGLVFSPNFFGVRPPRAMHGYAPELESQHGVVATSASLPGSPSSLTSVEAHWALREFFTAEA